MRAPQEMTERDVAYIRNFFVSDDYVGSAVTKRVADKSNGASRRLNRGELIVSTEQLGGLGVDVSESARFFFESLRNRYCR